MNNEFPHNEEFDIAGFAIVMFYSIGLPGIWHGLNAMQWSMYVEFILFYFFLFLLLPPPLIRGSILPTILQQEWMGTEYRTTFGRIGTGRGTGFEMAETSCL